MWWSISSHGTITTSWATRTNAFMTITRKTLLQAQDGQISDNHKQSMYSNIPLVNQNMKSSHQSQDVHPHNQSTVILQQFSIIAQELWNFIDKVSGDLNKITWACTTAWENTGKLMENAISQILTRTQGSTPTEASPPRESWTLDQSEYQTLHMMQTWQFPGKQIILVYHNTLMRKHITYKYCRRHPCAPCYVSQQQPNLTPFDFNKFVVELFQCQMKLTHSTQHLQCQMTHALQNIARSSMFQKNQYFINDIPIFKAKVPESFDDWLEQIDKVASLTNKDSYKLAPAKSWGSFSRTFSSFPPLMG